MSLNAILPTNFILDVDTYKGSHWWMIPSNVVNVHGVICARKPFIVRDFDDVDVININEIVMSGGQLLSTYLSTVIITEDMVDEAELEFTEQGIEFPRHLWETLLNKKLPITIKAIPDGTVVPVGVPLVTIKLTKDDDKLNWLGSYIETMSQRYIWKMTTVASIARHIKIMIKDGMMETAGHIDGIDWMFHVFGARGADSGDASIKAAIATLQIFNGTDTVDANRYIKKIYDTTKSYGGSISATEHSVTCMNSNANERNDYQSACKSVDWLEHEVKRKNGWAAVAAVGDTYDMMRFARDYIGGDELRARIERSGGCMVVRPDTGDTVQMPCDVIDALMSKFGYRINPMGYKVLPNCIRVLQGDGIGIEYFPKLMVELRKRKLSMENLAFGCGSGITHEHGRDTFSFCQKATSMKNIDTWIDLFKDPITDIHKRSHRGLVTTYYDSMYKKFFVGLETDSYPLYDNYNCVIEVLVPIYIDGELHNIQTFDQVRSRCFEV